MRKQRPHKGIVLTLFIAILVLQTFVPMLGYIPTPVANITIIQITVALGSLLFGLKEGALLGLVWGGLSLLHNLLLPTSLISPIFINPMVSVVPRLLDGLMIAFLAQFLLKKFSVRFTSMVVGFSSAFLNTLLVSISIILFEGRAYAQFLHVPIDILIPSVISVLSFNAILESIASTLLVGVIGPFLLKRWEKFKK